MLEKNVVVAGAVALAAAFALMTQTNAKLIMSLIDEDASPFRL